jgi:Lon protease-like protein
MDGLAPAAPVVLPMFPLGAVLFPAMALPLHVFEPRYRQLVHDCLEERAEPEFGVVLIERGSEVGGGDVRTMAGTVARIVQAAGFDDGRWALGCVGVRRIRVRAWLDDDPYPRAEVEEWPDEPIDDPGARPVEEVARAVRRALALHAELGDRATLETAALPADPVLASYQLASVAPFGSADRQALLEARGPEARLALLDELVRADLADLELRLRLDDAAGGDAGPDGPGIGPDGPLR